MATKWPRASSSSSDSSVADKKKKQQVSVATFKQWQTSYEKEYQSLSWLRCSTDEHNPSLVDTLSCAFCTRFDDKIRGLKNLSSAWISGSNNHRTSNIVDHAKSEQHKASMMCLCADQAKSKQLNITSYSPIARCLLKMDQTSKERMRKNVTS